VRVPRRPPLSRRHGTRGAFAQWDSPAAERNKQPIAEVLASVLPDEGIVLEVASGTGQHAEHFARDLPKLVWQPSEADEALRGVIGARVESVALENLCAPIAFDVHAQQAPLPRADAVLCINMIHIAPWSACEALLGHARTLLAPGAPLVLYGPFMRDGVHTAPSNAVFDASLRARNPTWGLRDLTDVDGLARLHGFTLALTIAMPANNLTLVWRRER
jgi:hypothetical protein